MIRSLTAAALLGGTLLFAVAPQAETQGALSPASLCNSIDIAPVLNYDITGATLVGPLHTHLTVYNYGFATISKVDETVFPSPGQFVDAATVQVPVAVVDQLMKSLADSGAWKLCDQNLSVADLPLTTVTVLTPKADARAHTFSYWVGSGNYGDVDGKIRSFIDTYFPGF